MTISEENLIWLDLEMTGLDPNRDRILEIATIVTNNDLDILAEGPVFAIYQTNKVLEAMNDWNTSHHTNSGLIKRIKTIGVTETKAEIETLVFLKNYSLERKSPLCGNSVYQDRRFLHRYMPSLEQFFHYRHLDVSTLKILAQRWAPQIMSGLIKKLQHLALQDIRDSIEELRYYRNHLLK